MLDNRNHVDVSIKDKFKQLMKPSIFKNILLVQQDELERMVVNKIDRPPYVVYIEQLYQHYIVDGKTKAELCN